MSIVELQKSIREAGRIRIGQLVPASKGGTRPAKLETFRITSSDRLRIEQAAEVYGGEVTEWESPNGRQWQVVTTADTLDVLVPPKDLAFSQWYELWSAGGCQRRCNGATETLTGADCLCNPEARECDIHTRLSVLLRALPGLGVWRLDTQGYYAAVELAGSFQLIQMAIGAGRLLPARMRLEQRSVKRPGANGKPQTFRFAVPILDVDITPERLLAGAAETLQLEAAASEDPPFTPVPATPPSFLPTIAEQSERPTPRPRAANAAPEIPSSGRSRRTRRSAPEDEGESDAAEPAAASSQGVTAGGSPPARPRGKLPPRAAKTTPDDPQYWSTRVHAAAGEHGIDHDGVRLITAALCRVDVADLEAYTTKDLVEADWQDADTLLRSLPAAVKGADSDADLDAISTWLWPRAAAKGLDSWEAIDAVVVAATGKQPDELSVPEWVAFAARLAAGEYDAAQKAS